MSSREAVEAQIVKLEKLLNDFDAQVLTRAEITSGNALELSSLHKDIPPRRCAVSAEWLNRFKELLVATLRKLCDSMQLEYDHITAMYTAERGVVLVRLCYCFTDVCFLQKLRDGQLLKSLEKALNQGLDLVGQAQPEPQSPPP